MNIKEKITADGLIDDESLLDIELDEFKKFQQLLEEPKYSPLKDLLTFVLMGAFIAFIILFLGEKDYVDKKIIKNDINLLIKNSADFNTIKHVFENKKVTEKTNYTILVQGNENSYAINITLSQVLLDIKADLFLSGKTDVKQISKIDALIELNNAKNPFDGLPMNQKDIFENIVLKANSNYPKIQTDINKLSNEMRNQNSEIAKYDTNAEINYYITIVSFITALGMASFQIFQSRPRKLREIVLAALNDIETHRVKSEKSEKG